jgi:hypothetical protein
MKDCSSVVSWRGVELVVVFAGFKYSSAEVDSKVVFRRLFMLIVNDVFVRLEAILVELE